MLKSRFLAGFTAVILAFSLRAQAEADVLASDAAPANDSKPTAATTPPIAVRSLRDIEMERVMWHQSSVEAGKFPILGEIF